MNMTNAKQNHSIQSMNIDNRLFIKLLMNICSLLSLSFAIIVSSFIIIYTFLIYNSRNKSKNFFDISSILTCNTCLAIICSSIIFILVQLSHISGDHNIVSLKWIILWACHIRGYLLFSFVNSIYLSYVLQAGYRLFRIVFHGCRCSRRIPNLFYYIFLQWMISFTDLIPILFTGKNLTTSIDYLSEDFYCQVPATNTYSLMYSVVIVYVIPLCCMCIIYIWIIIYIQRNTRYRLSTSTLKLRQNKRDTIIIKRICIIMILLVILGIPSSIIFIIYIITDYLYWTFYRLSWTILSISYVFISLSSIYVTPQLYKPIRIIFRHSKHYNKSSKGSNSINRNNTQQTKEEDRVLRVLSSDDTIELDLLEKTISRA